MGAKKQNFFADCVGAVTILMEDRVVFQGQIVKDREEDRKTECFQPQINVEVDNGIEFILLELNCDASIIRENGNIETTNPPLYQAGDLVRLNVANISSIGPSGGCNVKGKGKDD